MAKIIVISNSKGGTGKSTICMQFANYLVAKGKKVVILDADEGQTVNELRKMELKANPDAEIPWDVWNASNNSQAFAKKS